MWAGNKGNHSWELENTKSFYLENNLYFIVQIRVAREGGPPVTNFLIKPKLQKRIFRYIKSVQMQLIALKTLQFMDVCSIYSISENY